MRSLSSQAGGFSLLEALVAMVLTSIALLALAPMFLRAQQATQVGADMGNAGALAIDQLERLRGVPWGGLDAGGSLDSDVDGYCDDTNPGFVIRWQIADNGTPARTKTITVVALADGNLRGPRRRAELTLVRGH